METRTIIRIISVIDFLMIFCMAFVLWLFLYGGGLYKDLERLRYLGLLAYLIPKWKDIAIILLPVAFLAGFRSGANIRRITNKRLKGLRTINEIVLLLLLSSLFLGKFTYLGSYFGYRGSFPYLIEAKAILPVILISLLMGLILGVVIFIHHSIVLKVFSNKLVFGFIEYEEMKVIKEVERTKKKTS